MQIVSQQIGYAKHRVLERCDRSPHDNLLKLARKRRGLCPTRVGRQDNGLLYSQILGSDYSCNGLEEWGKKYAVKVTGIYSDPVSPDYNSLVLQFLSTNADAVNEMPVGRH
jgi:hypothetical protein